MLQRHNRLAQAYTTQSVDGSPLCWKAMAPQPRQGTGGTLVVKSDCGTATTHNTEALNLPGTANSLSSLPNLPRPSLRPCERAPAANAASPTPSPKTPAYTCALRPTPRTGSPTTCSSQPTPQPHTHLQPLRSTRPCALQRALTLTTRMRPLLLRRPDGEKA